MAGTQAPMIVAVLLARPPCDRFDALVVIAEDKGPVQVRTP